MHRRAAATRPLGVLAVAVALLAAACTSSPDDEPEDAEPEPTAEATAEPTEEATEPVDEETAEANERLARIAQEVSALRELEIQSEVETEVVGGDELRKIVTDRDRDAESMERLADSSQVLAALRHVPPDAELDEIVDELHASAVVGLYDAETSVAYVSGEEVPLTPGAATTAAHELTHALQDQHFDLGRLEEIPVEDGDAALGFLAVVEGDAVLVEEEWAATHQTEEERQDAEDEQLAGAERQLSALEDVPPYIVETFAFPYVAGERFVAALIEHGGYAAVDAALEEPPTTTLEVLDPQTYLDGFHPVDVDAGQAPAADFEPGLSSSFGAFDLLAMFGAAGSAEAQAGAAAWPAWIGGSLSTWERDDELVVVGAWQFDEAERADEVCAALPAWYADVADGERTDDRTLESSRDAFAVDCEDERVNFAIAPDPSLAEAAIAESAGGP